MIYDKILNQITIKIQSKFQWKVTAEIYILWDTWKPISRLNYVSLLFILFNSCKGIKVNKIVVGHS